MFVDRFHIVFLFLSNPCTPSSLSKEAFVYFVCPTEIPQPPFTWKYYGPSTPIQRFFSMKTQSSLRTIQILDKCFECKIMQDYLVPGLFSTNALNSKCWKII